MLLLRKTNLPFVLEIKGVTECAFWQRKRHQNYAHSLWYLPLHLMNFSRIKIKATQKLNTLFVIKSVVEQYLPEYVNSCKNLNREITEISWRHNIFQNPNIVILSVTKR
jgi:hypothetical protein